jgi:hypothetical protein
MTLETNLPIVKKVGESFYSTEYFEDYLREISLVADAVADISSVDATDLASAIALANETKAQFNDLLAKLRVAGKLNE